MSKRDLAELERRTRELEQLVWSIFRVLETFITLNELSSGTKESDEDDQA